jgi:hypothetical protein
MRHAISPSVVEYQAGPIVGQHFARPIGGGGRGGASTTSAYNLRAKPVNGHVSANPPVKPPTLKPTCKGPTPCCARDGQSRRNTGFSRIRLFLFCLSAAALRTQCISALFF